MNTLSNLQPNSHSSTSTTTANHTTHSYTHSGTTSYSNASSQYQSKSYNLPANAVHSQPLAPTTSNAVYAHTHAHTYSNISSQTTSQVKPTSTAADFAKSRVQQIRKKIGYYGNTKGNSHGDSVNAKGNLNKPNTSTHDKQNYIPPAPSSKEDICMSMSVNKTTKAVSAISVASTNLNTNALLAKQNEAKSNHFQKQRQKSTARWSIPEPDNNNPSKHTHNTSTDALPISAKSATNNYLSNYKSSSSNSAQLSMPGQKYQRQKSVDKHKEREEQLERQMEREKQLQRFKQKQYENRIKNIQNINKKIMDMLRQSTNVNPNTHKVNSNDNTSTKNHDGNSKFQVHLLSPKQAYQKRQSLNIPTVGKQLPPTHTISMQPPAATQGWFKHTNINNNTKIETKENNSSKYTMMPNRYSVSIELERQIDQIKCIEKEKGDKFQQKEEQSQSPVKQLNFDSYRNGVKRGISESVQRGYKQIMDNHNKNKGSVNLKPLQSLTLTNISTNMYNTTTSSYLTQKKLHTFKEQKQSHSNSTLTTSVPYISYTNTNMKREGIPSQQKIKRHDQQVNKYKVQKVDQPISKKQTIRLTQKLAQQITLDQNLRYRKWIFSQWQNQQKWTLLNQSLPKTTLSIPQSSLQSTFTLPPDEHNPFFEPPTSPLTPSCIPELLSAYTQASQYWQDHIVEKFPIEALQKQYFNVTDLDLGRKGYLSVEDLVCFVNLYAGKFFRNRDAVTLFKRFCGGRKGRIGEGQDGRLQYEHFLDVLVK